MGVQMPLWEPTLIFFVYILRKGISEYDRLNIWPGISLWYLGWSWTCRCKWSSCLSLLGSWAHRLATVPGSSSVLWGTSTMLFVMVSFGLPSSDAQQYVFWTLLVEGKRGSEGVCPAGRLHPVWGRQASLCGSAQRWASNDKCCWQMASETRLSQLREVWSWRTGPHPVTAILWTSSV